MPQDHGRDADAKNRQGGVWQHHHQHRCGDDRNQPDSQPRSLEGAVGSRVTRSSRWWRTPITSAVTSTDTTPAGAIRRKNSPPLMCAWPSTIRLVRLEPGRISEPAFESRMQA